MIVELIGCAGAGKSTLARVLCERSIAGRRVVMMPDLVLGAPLLRRVTHPTAVNVVQELRALPSFVRALPADREFLELARRSLWRPGVSTFDRLNGMRGIVRKLGMYRRAATGGLDDVVLSDEGTVLSAYNLFVTAAQGFGRADVDTFTRLVPLPDRVVYVRAPVATLVERALSRPTVRRQHRGRTATEVERDIRATVRLFDLVASSLELGHEVLVVDNDDADGAARRTVVAEVCAWLEASIPPLRHADHRAGRLGMELGA